MSDSDVLAWSDTPPVYERVVAAISRLATVMRAGLWQFATAEGLNPAQAEILHLLHLQGTGMRLSWVAEQMAISLASASDSVTALVAKGLVRKAKDPNDRRALAIVLTARGRRLAARVSQSVRFVVEAVEAMPQSSQHALLAGLLGMIGELQKRDWFAQIRTCASCKHFKPRPHPDPAGPHHCNLVGAALPAYMLRLHCTGHEPAEPTARQQNWSSLA